MEGFVKRDLGQLEDTLASLKKKPGLEIFDVTQAMAQRCTEFSFLQLGTPGIRSIDLGSDLSSVRAASA